ncbi:hypothetical protein A2680_04645 [Candidatus Kaiserbacteria bacterium RIFCSPHIGHO2_01_FULL_55_37]|nr:MAG: hypothetical protein A2680_04645 [Candidatus Kaiserbacteria bacterium RIFCSPHIGHO2_01_FULL_55_37]
MRSIRFPAYVGGVLILALALGVYFFQVYRQGSPQTVSSERSHVESLFSGRTPAEALALFKNENATGTSAEEHTAAHLFGEALYRQEGLDGFSVCDGSFGFGCYHSFLGLAIAEHGPDVVKKLDEGCVRAYGPQGTGCFHGIGHGVLAYYGYGFADVGRALSLCAQLSWKGQMSGCSDGVFMEYNFRVMEKDPTKKSRPFTMSERYEPCLSVREYPQACYFGLGSWWATALPQDASLSSRMGEFCAKVKREDLRRACYRGIGYGILPQLRFEAEPGEAFCDAVATGVARVWCREGMAWAFYADPATRDKAHDVCTRGLSQSEAGQCDKEYLFATQ